MTLHNKIKSHYPCKRYLFVSMIVLREPCGEKGLTAPFYLQGIQCRLAPMYDVLGRQVDKTYRGIVIQNGQAFLVK